MNCLDFVLAPEGAAAAAIATLVSLSDHQSCSSMIGRSSARQMAGGGAPHRRSPVSRDGEAPAYCPGA